MAAAARDVTVAVSAWLAAGGDEAGPQAAVAALAIGTLQGAVRHLDFGEAAIEAACDRAVAEDRAAFPRPRRGLRAVR